MKRMSIAALVFVVAYLSSATVWAGDVESVLVTGAYAPSAELTAAVSVLDEEAIRQLNKRSLVEVLQTVPGLLVERQGGPGGLTAVSIRGAEANFTLVLLDGVPVNDPTNTRGGGFDFANLNPSLVKRLEVVRGAQSAVYGSDALAGVINIVTRRPRQGHNAQLSAEWGEDDYSNYTVAAQGVAGSWDYSLGFANRDEGEPIPGSARESDSANLRLGWLVAKDHRLEIGYRFVDGDRTSYPEQSGGPEYAVTDNLDRSDYREEVYSVQWRGRLSPAWEAALAANRFTQEDDFNSPGISPYYEVPPNGADTDFQRDQVQLVNTLYLNDSTQFNFGADYRNEDGDSDAYLEYFGSQLPADYHLDRSTTGVFAGVSTALIDGDLLLQASGRYDDPDGFDSESTFNLGLRYRLTQELSVNANWGEAFKLPSFSALGHPLVGNPDLEPETASNWDIGLNWSPRNELRFVLTAFFNDFEDLVDFDSETFRNVNRSNVETSGLEFEAHWQPVNELSFSGQVTYTDIDVKGADTVLTGRPEWLASMTVNWQLSAGWQTTLDYRYNGEQWATSRHTGLEQSSELDDYHRLDWVLRWSPGGNWQLQLSADNLLDESYEDSIGFVAPGRSFRAGIHYGL